MNILLLTVALLGQVKVINFENRTEVTVTHSADPDDYVVVNYAKHLHAIAGTNVIGRKEQIYFHDLPEFEETGKPSRSKNPPAIRVQYPDSKHVKVVIPSERFTSDLEITVYPGKKKMNIKATVVTVTEQESATP